VRETMEFLETGERLKGVLEWLQPRIDSDLPPWDFLYSRVWPPYTARALVAAGALIWIGWIVFRLRPEPVRATFLILAGVVLLSPTVHPWYLLWVLPFAAACLSWPWMLLAMLIPLSYLAPVGADVGWLLRVAEFLPPVLLAMLLYRTTVTQAPPSRDSMRP